MSCGCGGRICRMRAAEYEITSCDALFASKIFASRGGFVPSAGSRYSVCPWIARARRPLPHRLQHPARDLPPLREHRHPVPPILHRQTASILKSPSTTKHRPGDAAAPPSPRRSAKTAPSAVFPSSRESRSSPARPARSFTMTSAGRKTRAAPPTAAVEQWLPPHRQRYTRPGSMRQPG